jgi:hypothetical protein
VKLTYRQLETTLIAFHNIKPDRETTFRSRIKQLQRLQFPSGVNVGRGEKMLYTGEHLFKLATAFELISSGLPALGATSLVEQHWTELSAGYGLARLLISLPKSEVGAWPATSIFAQIQFRSLHEIQFTRYGDQFASNVMLMDLEEAKSTLDFTKDRTGNSALIFMLSEIFYRLTETATTRGGVPLASVDRELLTWLPRGREHFVQFQGPYPDRSNLEIRRSLHLMNGADPSAHGDAAEQEAKAFYERYLEPPKRNPFDRPPGVDDDETEDI